VAKTNNFKTPSQSISLHECDVAFGGYWLYDLKLFFTGFDQEFIMCRESIELGYGL